jgi:hypothetical protein
MIKNVNNMCSDMSRKYLFPAISGAFSFFMITCPALNTNEANLVGVTSPPTSRSSDFKTRLN